MNSTLEGSTLQVRANPAATIRLEIPSSLQGSSSLAVGARFGHYEILGELGQGGMGVVYEAYDHRAQRRVALKVLQQRLDSEEARQRFFREGQLTALISHPNCCYVFAAEEIEGQPIIAMEIAAGGTLSDRIRHEGPLAVREAVEAILQIITGLDAVLAAGVIHRDIKPSNCFIDSDGTVKVGDFGIAISNKPADAAAIGTGFAGTPAYASPEQLRGENLDVRSDIYAVGATFFHLLVGGPPFKESDLRALRNAVERHQAPSPSMVRPEVPENLAKIVLRCLEKARSARFQSYAELRSALAPRWISKFAPLPLHSVFSPYG